MSLQRHGHGGAGVKRRREDDEGDGGEAEAAKQKARLPYVPEGVKLIILRKLQLKFAIRTEALSKEWLDLWTKRWDRSLPRPASAPPHWVEERVVPRVDVGQKALLAKMERWSKENDRFDIFSLVVEASTMNIDRFQRCLDSAAACRVGDLYVELGDKASSRLCFHFPKSSRQLGRLSLRGICVSIRNYAGTAPFPYLETMQLHSVDVEAMLLLKMIELCPNLRVLDLRNCNRIDRIDFKVRESTLRRPPRLRIVSIVKCGRITKVDFRSIPSLRSFRYSGNFVSSFFLPARSSLQDLYICFNGRIPGRLFKEFLNNPLPNLSEIKFLTICSKALQAVSPLPDANEQQLAKLNKFWRLRELQLLMFEMEAVNLDSIYSFFQNRHCTDLEKLFVQLPTIGRSRKRLAAPLVGGSVGVEPKEVGLENLKEVKILNFNWNSIEVQLVSFLLKKARPLHKLLLVSPNERPVNVPGVREANLSAIDRAIDDGKIVLKESDKDETRPFHSEVFAKF